MKTLLKLLLNAVALLIIALMIPGFNITEPKYAILAALLISLVNLIVKPALIFFTFPITILTLGLFLLVINALMFWLASHLAPGVEISGFWTSLLGSMLYSIVSSALQWMFLKNENYQ